MPSTRKQKAREERSRHSDVLSDIENLDVILGNIPENELENDLENDPDIESSAAGLQENADTSRGVSDLYLIK